MSKPWQMSIQNCTGSYFGTVVVAIPQSQLYFPGCLNPRQNLIAAQTMILKQNRLMATSIDTIGLAWAGQQILLQTSGYFTFESYGLKFFPMWQCHPTFLLEATAFAVFSSMLHVCMF